MIEFLLAGALLLSDAEDCAVLEAVLPEPVEAASERVELLDENTVIWRGLGRVVRVDRMPPLLAHPPGWGVPRRTDVIILGERERAQSQLEEMYPTLSPEERVAMARAYFEGPYPPAQLADRPFPVLPDDLFESFLMAAAGRNPWDCVPDGWYYGTWEAPESAPRLPFGTSQHTYVVSRPGYSADGNTAMVYYYGTRTFPEYGQADSWRDRLRAANMRGYLFFQRTASGWQLADRNIYMMSGTGEP